VRTPSVRAGDLESGEDPSSSLGVPLLAIFAMVARLQPLAACMALQLRPAFSKEAMLTYINPFFLAPRASRQAVWIRQQESI
jgi:hypothetical protein